MIFDQNKDINSFNINLHLLSLNKSFPYKFLILISNACMLHLLKIYFLLFRLIDLKDDAGISFLIILYFLYSKKDFTVAQNRYKQYIFCFFSLFCCFYIVFIIASFCLEYSSGSIKREVCQMFISLCLYFFLFF